MRVQLLGRVTQFLDVPLFLMIVYCGRARPESWAHFLAAITVALFIAMILSRHAGARAGVFAVTEDRKVAGDLDPIRRFLPNAGPNRPSVEAISWRLTES